jgi:energy-coupling factor transporter ATP-binding protein EcfA2
MAKRVPKYRPDPGFPRDLLAKPIQDRLDYFEKYMVRHPYFRTALLDVLKLVTRSGPWLLIFLMGPTGVGKSALLEQLKRVVVGVVRNKLREDFSMLPFISIVAREPRIGNYDWNAHDRDILEAAKDPLIKYKLPMPIEEWQKTHKSKAPPRKALGRDLQFAAEEELRQRKPPVLIIDEAQHIARITSHRMLSSQVQVLKTTAKTTGVRQLLAGTEKQLKSLCNLDAQLSRISREVYLPAYQFTEQGFELFVKVVLRFQRHLPLPEAPNLKPLSEYLFQGSLGRVGILKDWLYETLSDVLHDGKTTIKKEDLARRAPTEQKLNEWRTEVEGTNSEYFNRLMCEEEAEPAEHEEDSKRESQNTSLHNSVTVAKKSGRQGRRVGDRKPERDPVGGLT